MHIFLTGATGHVGSAVLDALLRGRQTVTALVRTREGAARVGPDVVQTIVGDMAEPHSYAETAEACDAIIHTASENSPRRQDLDRLVLDTLLAAAARRASSGKPACVIYTSGTWVLGDTPQPADERAPVNPPPLVAWRPAIENLVLAAGTGLVRTAVIRPGTVYGGARGTVADLLKDAAHGLIRIVGDGHNHWSCVYDHDLADLYLRVVTDAQASGIFHANDEADERVTDIVEAIAARVGTRPDVRHMPIEEARTKIGPYADALVLDQVVRSPRARALGWSPTLRSIGGNIARLLEEMRSPRESG